MVQEKTVPTALERIGDFSQSLNTNGTRITVNDPLNGKKYWEVDLEPRHGMSIMSPRKDGEFLFADDDEPLEDGDVIALIPPVAGG